MTTPTARVRIEDKTTHYGVISTLYVKKSNDIEVAVLQRLSVNGKISYTDPTIVENCFTISKDGKEFEYWEEGVEFPDAKNKAACWNHYNKKWNTIEALLS